MTEWHMYLLSIACLDYLLENGKISKEEHRLADEYLRRTYSIKDTDDVV